MSPYKLVLFDLDGTYMNTSDGVLSAVSYTIKKMGLDEITDEKLKSFIGPPVEYSFRTIYNLTEEKVKEAAGIFRNAYKDKFLFGAKLYDGIVEITDKLRANGIKCGIATYKRESYTLKLLEHFDLIKHFDIIHGSDEDGKLTKSDIIQLCINEAEAARENTVMIGDTSHDALAASKLGVDFIAVTYGFEFSANLPVDVPNIGIANNSEEIFRIVVSNVQ